MGKLCSECNRTHARRGETCSPACKSSRDTRLKRERRSAVAGGVEPARATLPLRVPPPAAPPPIPDFLGDRHACTQSYPYTEDTVPRPEPASNPPTPADVNDVASKLARMALDLGCSVMLLRQGATCTLKLNPQLTNESNSTVQSSSNGQSTDVDTGDVSSDGDPDWEGVR